MSLKPWREIAKPHQDVLEGSFKQSEFAADITQVAKGRASAEYQDAEKFYSRTFITEGMRLLLRSVAQRLSGEDGDPVIQLQTSFGGGKTHTMLAVYHLAAREVSTSKLEGIPPILDEAGIVDLPNAKIAVIDGINLSPSQPQIHEGLRVNTIWGEVAYQLLGNEGYELVKDSDVDGTSPGKEVLIALLKRAAPCVILIDELQKYFSQFGQGKKFSGGSYESNLACIQALTEATKVVPNSILLASLPESEAEIGDTFGQKTLIALEKHFGRVESVWKPVATEEAFEIVSRRLFENAGDKAQVHGICQQFSDFYRANAQDFPVETQSTEYYERLCNSYPIHPEIFDRLYEDWSTLDKFQRTRGVLQYLAVIIHRLWADNNQDALIMPGSIPLDDSTVRNKSIHYLPPGWEPVLESEVDGPRSEPDHLDGQDTRFGSVQAAHRTMRTIFLGSAPNVSSQVTKGLERERILLGSVQPGQILGAFEDVLKRLRDKLQYLYSDADRYWLDTKPNLRREMESRIKNINDRDQLIPELRKRVSAVFGRQHNFSGIHVFTPSQDVPDDFGSGPRLVVLPPEVVYSKTESSNAFDAAKEITQNRGEQPRHKTNRLIFMLPDSDSVSRLKDAGRTYLAWNEIVADLQEGKLNLDSFQATRAKASRDGAEAELKQMIRQTYRWLVCPHQLDAKAQNIDWEAIAVSPNAQNLVQEIEAKLREEEWVIYEWSPVHLKNLLEKWYFTEGRQTVSALKVYQDTCHYLYMPRLVNDQVFRAAIENAVSTSDYFGYANGQDGSEYLGFRFGKGSSMVALDEYSLFIEKQSAAEYSAAIEAARAIPITTKPENEGSEGAPDNPIDGLSDPILTNPPGELVTSFYANKLLDDSRAKIEFSDVVDEVIEQFSLKTGVNIEVSIEIRAKSKDGFDESLQRSVKENCSTLGFLNAEFEKD